VRLGLSLQVSPLQLSAAVREDAGLSERVATAVATEGQLRRARGERGYRSLAGAPRVCPSLGRGSGLRWLGHPETLQVRDLHVRVCRGLTCGNECDSGPAGWWLLPAARTVRTPGYGGRWPTPWQGVLWDLGRGADAPRNDGVADAPQHRVASLTTLEQARGGVCRRAATTEGRASRLLGTTVTLLAAAVALAGLQLRASETEHRLWLRLVLVAAALPAAGAAVLLAVGAPRAVDADLRVGFYGSNGAARLAEGGLRGVLALTVTDAALSAWTARKKATSLVQAQACSPAGSSSPSSASSWAG